jgi:cell wall assembly regulator SMI1
VGGPLAKETPSLFGEEEDVTGWQRLVDVLGADAAKLALRPPSSEAAIVGAETLFERALPVDYRALLAIADGQDEGGLALFDPEALLLPIAKVIEQWLYTAKFVVRELDFEPVAPDMAVRPLVWHPTRIPIAVDYLGHGPFLDLWPGPAGTVGQVITLVTECDFEVIGASLDDYFSRRAAALISARASSV